MSDGTIRHRGGFTTIPNAAIGDRRISIEARGLLVLLRSHSCGWRFRFDNIAEQCGVGRDKLQRMIRELKEHGYLIVQPRQDAQGRVNGQDWITEVEPHRLPEKPSDGSTVGRFSRPLKNTNSKNEQEREALPLEAPHSEPETVSKQIPNVSRMEREGSAEKGKKGSRLLDSFTVPTDWIAWAEDQGMPPDMAQLEAAKFPDFWRSQPGQKGVKLDWLATWRNWCRSAMQRANIKPASQGGRMSDAQAMEWCVEMLIEPIREADRIRREFAAQPDKAPKLHPRLREMVDAVDQTCKERGWTDEKRRLLGQAARERLAEQARLV
jgi:hypothetical protein